MAVKTAPGMGVPNFDDIYVKRGKSSNKKTLSPLKNPPKQKKM